MLLDSLFQDARYALRTLRSSPVFTAVAILTLALGIGVNTAIFSLMDAVILRSLPVSHPEELLNVSLGGDAYLSNPMWEHLQERQSVFSGLLAYGRWGFNLAQSGEVRNVNGNYVSGRYFATLGIGAALGRTLNPSDDVRGCAATAVLSEGFWGREFGRRADTIGKTISLDNHLFEIVGVAQSGFTGVEVGEPADIFIPICSDAIVWGANSSLDTSSGWLQILGRPRPGVSVTQVRAQLAAISHQIIEASVTSERLPDYLNKTLQAEPAANGLSYIRRSYVQPLMALMAMATSVLLIACTNLALLFAARGAAREREIAIRIVVGCGRTRLIRQILMEGLLLSFAGVPGAILLSKMTAQALASYLHIELDLGLNVPVFVFAAGMAILTSILFGLIPAWRASRVDPNTALKAGKARRLTSSFNKVAAITQIAISVFLVVGAALLFGTLWNLRSLDLGIEPQHVLMAIVDLRNGNDDPQRRGLVITEMLTKLRATPGVRSASTSAIIPLCACSGSLNIVSDGNSGLVRNEGSVLFNKISDQYFDTMGTPFAAGRDFTNVDTPGSPKVAVINEGLAQQYFGAANPLGRHIRIRNGSATSAIGDAYEIVGVVKDAKYGRLRDDIGATLYLTRNQDSTPPRKLNFQIRTELEPTASIGVVKDALSDADPAASFEFKSIPQRIDELLQRERLLAVLSGVFAGLALLLAMIGLYGTMSYGMAPRRHEIGIRIALGAQYATLVRMVLKEIGLIVAAGVVIGLSLSIVGARFIHSLLYGLKENDPMILVATAVIVATVGLTAGYLGVRRTLAIDVSLALRED